MIGHQQLDKLQLETVVNAQGALLALLAAHFDREDVLESAELAHSLATFAAVTAADRPEEGRILALWASYVQDIGPGLADRSSSQSGLSH